MNLGRCPLGLTGRVVQAVTRLRELVAGPDPGLAMIVLEDVVLTACTSFHRCPSARTGAHEADRIDDIENGQRQIEDRGQQRQEDSYDGGAGLQQHRRAALLGEGPQRSSSEL